MTESIEFMHFLDVTNDDWIWPDFRPREMACKGTGKVLVVYSFMSRLQNLRDLIGPLAVASGYRTPEYDIAVGGKGPHTTGRAVDIRISGPLVHLLIRLACGLGFTGIGVKQKGIWPGRFIHLDDLENTKAHPRPRVWSY